MISCFFYKENYTQFNNYRFEHEKKLTVAKTLLINFLEVILSLIIVISILLFICIVGQNLEKRNLVNKLKAFIKELEEKKEELVNKEILLCETSKQLEHNRNLLKEHPEQECVNINNQDITLINCLEKKIERIKKEILTQKEQIQVIEIKIRTAEIG